MPIYSYRCENCGFQKDALQKLSDAPLRDCPECGQPRLVKQLTAAGFQLKGSGWYATDFRGASSSGAATAAAGSAAEGASGDSAATASNTTTAAGGCGASCACH